MSKLDICWNIFSKQGNAHDGILEETWKSAGKTPVKKAVKLQNGVIRSYKQLQDVKRFQHTVIARLKGKVSANEIHLWYFRR